MQRSDDSKADPQPTETITALEATRVLVMGGTGAVSDEQAEILGSLVSG